MTLTKNPNAAEAQFEDEGAVSGTTQATGSATVNQANVTDTATASAAQAATPAAEPVTETSRALAPRPLSTALAETLQKAGVLTAGQIRDSSLIEQLKNAIRVEWDSLPTIGANNTAKFVIKGDSEVKLGETIEIVLMSFQDLWVASPGDTEADNALVKYSHDGITSNEDADGEVVNMKEYLDRLKVDYPKAHIGHRVILVGELAAAEGGDATEHIGKLFQISLPDSGRRAFETYKLQSSYALGKGKAQPAEVLRMRLKAKEAKNGKNTYAKVEITQAN